MKTKVKTKDARHIQLNGLMTLRKLNNGLNTAYFHCTEDDVKTTPFIAFCKVQGMRDGNIYITERPKRKRNNPLYRQANSSLSLGHDGRYYFQFSISEDNLADLPQELVLPANAIAEKVMMDIIGFC